MRVLTVRHYQNIAKLNGLTFRRIKLVHVKRLVGCDLVLLSTGLNYGVNLRTSR